jgi:Spy/CpxP family protein refolding chaperone
MKTIKTLALGAAAAALLASVALAQEPGGHGQKMLDHVASVLNLTAAQKATAMQLHSDLQAKAAPLMQQSKQQWSEIHTLLDGVNPDATELGQKLIAAHATQTQLKVLHSDFVAKLSAILTSDQKTKLTQMEQLHQQMEGDGPPGFPHGHPGE